MDFISRTYQDPKDFKQDYRANAPFPHIVFDDFIIPHLLDTVLDEFPDLQSLQNKVEFAQQKQIKLASLGSSELSPAARHLVNSLNSDVFLEYLQELTGIEETLISDPYLSGGGYHEIKTGGVLKVHADFNKHPRLNLDRRLNLLLYLNKNWERDWGGILELYDHRDLSSPVVTVAPTFNRCVIFTTTSFTYHGHPDKVLCPPDVSRKSIALYYFSTGRPESEITSPKHSTIFVETKGEKFLSDTKDTATD